MYVRPISARLLRGMLSPAMRAISLALPLLVPRIGADHQHRAMAANDLALLAHRLHRRSYLHEPLLEDWRKRARASALPPQARPMSVAKLAYPVVSCQGVRIRGPSAVTAIVNSKCAASDPSCE